MWLFTDRAPSGPRSCFVMLLPHSSPPIAYLCGGINGLSDAAATTWRRQAADVLVSLGYRVRDPMVRDYRGIEAMHVDAIVDADLVDILGAPEAEGDGSDAGADLILVNAVRPSWGTAQELVYAMLGARAAIVGFGAGDRASPWLAYHTDLLLPTLETALAAISGVGQPQDIVSSDGRRRRAALRARHDASRSTLLLPCTISSAPRRAAP